MTEEFAKIYGASAQQILVKLDDGEHGPEVRFYARPAGLGVCSVAISGFKVRDDDNGWDAAEEFFSRVDERAAVEIIENMLEKLLES